MGAAERDAPEVVREDCFFEGLRSDGELLTTSCLERVIYEDWASTGKKQ